MGCDIEHSLYWSECCRRYVLRRFHCICDDGYLVKVVYPLEDSLPSNARIDARTRLVRRRSGGALSRRGPIMPLHSYGLLVGKIVGFREPRGHRPHWLLIVQPG